METYVLDGSARYFEAFKSYYVVWKPVQVFADQTVWLGLNRTMQYGNGYKKNGNKQDRKV